MIALGQKIRRLRVAQQMTQAELAGDQITRNMLSQIENGNAQPSLATILYLADKLDIAPGYFFAEDEDEFLYRKMQRIDKIKQAFAAGAWQRCMALCQDNLNGSDDEVTFILCRCAYQLALRAFAEGRLCAAHSGFVQTLEYASQTIYDTSSLSRTAYDYLTYLAQFDSALEIPSFIRPQKYGDNAEQPWFSAYLQALASVHAGDLSTPEHLLALIDFAEPAFAVHIRARMAMASCDYSGAVQLIERVLTPERGLPPSKPMVYLLYGDLEICCRETGDFERAYRYSTQRVKLLDILLTE